MPFVSEDQERWAFATKQPFARKWAAMTDQKSLPQHKGDKVASNFDRLATKLASRPGVTNPRALAAVIGARKYGRGTMQKAAARGVSASSIRK